MLVLEKIKYKNLLSSGNSFIEIPLNKWNCVLSRSKNGFGKSSVIDAIFYALFGKPYRNITLPSFINSINKKNLLTIIEFTIDNKQYVIKRGIKPKVFEIWKMIS